MASLEFENTPLWKEAQKIFNEGPTSTNYVWEVIVHTPDDDLAPLNVQSVNNVRDYAGSFGDEITVTTMFGMGTFAHRILKNREKLEVTLKKVPVTETAESENVDGKIQAERFTAYLIGDVSSPSLGQGKEAKDEDALNLTGLKDVHFQLIDKTAEQLIKIMTGGVGRKTTIQQLLTTMLATNTANVKVNGEAAVKGIDMIEADNKDLKEQVIIKQGVRLVDLADYLQARVGIYNAGLGSYYQGGYWYVFPLYDTTDFNRRSKTLTMLVMPENKLTGVERTFRTEEGATTVLVTGPTSFSDDAGTNYANYGNGVRFAHAERMMDANSDVSGNKVKVSRGKNNGEFITDQSPVNFAPVSSKSITANPFPELSLQAAKRGGMFQAVWENSDPSLILPGMVVKVVYSEGDDAMKDVYGIVHDARHVSIKPGAITSKKFINQSIVNVFVNDQIKPLDA